MDPYQYIDAFVSYLVAERHYSEKTSGVYAPALTEFWTFAESTTGFESWDKVSFECVREWVVSQMEKGRSASTVNKKLSALRSFYKYMLMQGSVTHDPTRRVKGPKKEKLLPMFVREGDMNRLLDEMTFAEDYIGQRDHLIILLFYSTGMRLSELVGLDVDSIDFYSSTIKVLGKRNKERIIPFGEELAEGLRSFLMIRAQQQGAATSAALFIGVKSPRINVTTVGKIVKMYLSQVTTIKKKSPHVLRHSFATAMLNNGAEIEVVKQLLGHESIATTEIYTHTTFEELKKVYAQAHPRAGEDE